MEEEKEKKKKCRLTDAVAAVGKRGRARETKEGRFIEEEQQLTIGHASAPSITQGQEEALPNRLMCHNTTMLLYSDASAIRNTIDEGRIAKVVEDVTLFFLSIESIHHHLVVVALVIVILFNF